MSRSLSPQSKTISFLEYCQKKSSNLTQKQIQLADLIVQNCFDTKAVQAFQNFILNQRRNDKTFTLKHRLYYKVLFKWAHDYRKKYPYVVANGLGRHMSEKKRTHIYNQLCQISLDRC